MIEFDLETLVPHRRPIRMIDEIIEISGDCATTAARVSSAWPTYRNGEVNALVLIELVAQTAAVVGGYKALTDPAGSRLHKGMLVAIKRADFMVDAIPTDTRLITRSSTRPLLENFKEIRGSVEIENRVIGDMILQGVQS